MVEEVKTVKAPAVTVKSISMPESGDVIVKEEPDAWFQGWKTIAWGLVMVTAPTAFDYLSKVDWTQYLSPNKALIVGGVVTILLRFVTSGPAFSKLSMKKAANTSL